MAEEYVIEWPYVEDPRYGWLTSRRRGRWSPMTVLLEAIRDPWGHGFYRQSTLPFDIWRDERRPAKGFLVLEPETLRELALILRLPKDPPGGEEQRTYYRCLYVADWHGGTSTQEGLVDGRRWVGVRDDGTVIHAKATRAEAIRHTLQRLRSWEFPPEPEPEAEPEGEDLVELGIVAEAHLGRG